MRYFIIPILFVLSCSSLKAQEALKALISTEKGIITIELYPEKAPLTVANFLRYLESGLYNGSDFFRVCTPENEAERDIKIEVIQAADLPEDKLFPTIPLETTQQTGLKHENGSLSMARGVPVSAQSSFFICINEQPELDFGGKRNPDGQGFAVFGKVIEGMDVVLAIQSGENENQILKQAIKIESIKKLD
ncbi:MAG: peptidylprolyl isomerase [Ignavibacteria bacterium]|nr:peptidylprolyl isomerase [Ignavibacteria bacterium]